MTHKEKAEKYVREKLPELRHLPPHPYNPDAAKAVVKLQEFLALTFIEREHADAARLYIQNYEDQRRLDYIKMLESNYPGHQPQLQHWLRVLEQESKLSLEFNHFKGTVLYVKEEYSGKPWVGFNLTTGQPATEEDYQKFNQIVGI